MNKLAVIDALETLSDRVNRIEHDPVQSNGIDRAVALISGFTDDNSWVPVEKQLPKDSEYARLYITIQYPCGVTVIKARWDHGYFIYANGRVIKYPVLAWKYLRYPEPYKEVSEES